MKKSLGPGKWKFGMIMATAAAVMLLSAGGAALAHGGGGGFWITGDFKAAPCNAYIPPSADEDLWTLLQETCGGIRTPALPINPTNHNWMESDYVLVTGKGGGSALFAVGELDTKYAPADAVTLALNKHRGYDLEGAGRTVRNVTGIEVVHAVPIVKGGTYFFSAEFVVSGAGIAPRTYNLADLEEMTPETYTNASGATWTGPTLRSVLHASGIDTRDMDGYVVVQATDGYAIVLSMYEATHRTGTQDDLLAIRASDGSINGTSAKDSGFARLILPGDKAPGRWISNVAQIVVHKLEECWGHWR